MNKLFENFLAKFRKGGFYHFNFYGFIESLILFSLLMLSVFCVIALNVVIFEYIKEYPIKLTLIITISLLELVLLKFFWSSYLSCLTSFSNKIMNFK